MTTEEKTPREWQPNETIAMRFIVACKGSKFTGAYGLEFADDVDFQNLPRATAIVGADPDVFFFIVPALSWNGIQNKLQTLGIGLDDRRQMSIGRAYKIPVQNTIFKKYPEHNAVQVGLKLTMGIAADGNDLIDTVRWSSSFLDGKTYAVDPETHPFIVVTLGCWNSFQLTAERLGIREKIRECRPMAIPLKKTDVFRTTHESFEAIRQKLLQEENRVQG